VSVFGGSLARHTAQHSGLEVDRLIRMADLIRAVFITIGNRHFWTPIMADYIALREETAWQAGYLLCECNKEPR
jgi:hypothetical protein